MKKKAPKESVVRPKQEGSFKPGSGKVMQPEAVIKRTKLNYQDQKSSGSGEESVNKPEPCDYHSVATDSQGKFRGK